MRVIRRLFGRHEPEQKAAVQPETAPVHREIETVPTNSVTPHNYTEDATRAMIEARRVLGIGHSGGDTSIGPTKRSPLNRQQ